VVFSKEIPYTDSPLDTIKLYFANNVIHLPSEYWRRRNKATSGDFPGVVSLPGWTATLRETRKSL